jgi:hypothetical protein
MVLTAEGTGQAELGSFFYIGRNVMGPRRLGTLLPPHVLIFVAASIIAFGIAAGLLAVALKF